MKDIIKKKGPYLVLRNKYKQFIESKNATNAPTNVGNINDRESASSISTSDNVFSSDISEHFDEELQKELDTYSQINVVDNSLDLTPVSVTFVGPNEYQSNNSHQTSIEIPNKRPKITSLFKAGSLQAFLNLSSDGKVLLIKKNKLNNELRQKLASLIIHEISNNMISKGAQIEIKSETFSAEICDLFPGETSDTYYTPYKTGRGGLRKEPCRGKLWSKYLKIKAQLKLIQKECSEDNKQLICENDTEYEQHLNFLRCAIEPFPKVLQSWEKTFMIRKRKFDGEESTDVIFEEYLILKGDDALKLFESDFNQIYEDKVDIIYSHWPKVARAILTERDERSVQVDMQKNILDIELRALVNISLLFSPLCLSRKSDTWRPSRLEVQESFFLIVKTLDELDEKIQQRRLRLDRINRSLQPFAFALEHGDSYLYYIYMYGTKYECDTHSAVRCLELLFKTFHAVNLEYPSECKHVWLCLQELVFQITATSKSSSTCTVTSDLKYHLNKN